MRSLWPALLLASCAGKPAIPPDKVVSNNPCVDAILAEIAAPGQVGAVSGWSHDAASGSAPLAWAKALPAIGAGAEEIIAARPRLALIGSFGNPAPLVRAEVRHLAFGVPGSVAESVTQVRSVAKAIGRVGAGERLVGRIDEATIPRRSLRGRPPYRDGGEFRNSPLPPILRGGTRPQASGGGGSATTAIIWLSGGFVPGSGTLQDELLARAGYRNASAAYGLKQWEVLPLETLVRNPPDIIFTPLSEVGDAGRALKLRHRVLARLNPRPRVIAFPDKLLNCGGPTIIAAMRVLMGPQESAHVERSRDTGGRSARVSTSLDMSGLR